MKNQRGRRSTGGLSLSSILPDELIQQILLRLPVKSLLRFKCVCKSGLSLISDPQFGKSHFDLAAAPTHRYRLRILNDSEIRYRDIDALLHDESAVVTLKFPLPFPSDENSNATVSRGNSPYILGSCRGFILVIYDLGNTIIWNPSTGVQRRIEDVENLGEDTLEFLTGFGYDKSTDDYLLVLITPIHVDPDFPYENEAHSNSFQYFSVRTNSWSRMEVVNDRYVYIAAAFRIGSFLNEALHWLVMSYDTKLQVIIAFDLVERSLSEIPLSHNLARKLKYNQYYLRVMGECLTLCYPGNATSTAEIWMMKIYKVQSSWTKLFVFSTCNIPRNVFFPICFTKRGEIFGSNGSGRLMILNHKGWLLDQCTVCPNPDQGQFIQNGCGLYRESLLSLPNDFEEASEDDQLTSASEEASEDDQ